MSSFKNESEATKWFCRQLEKCNAVIFAIVGQKSQQSGWPDRYVCHRHWRGWIEFKFNNGTVKPHQAHVIKRLNERGDRAIVVRYHNEIDTWVINDTVVPGRCFTHPPDVLDALIDSVS